MTAPKRRWFQFGLKELLILSTLLGIAWWQAARWPVMETFELAGPPSGRISVAIRPPTHREIATRGLSASAAIIALWIGGGAAWNAVRSRVQAS